MEASPHLADGGREGWGRASGGAFLSLHNRRVKEEYYCLSFPNIKVQEKNGQLRDQYLILYYSNLELQRSDGTGRRMGVTNLEN